MRLADALALRREWNAKGKLRYAVMRSGKRSPGVGPFYVKVDRS